MFRRDFMQRFTFASASALTGVRAGQAIERKVVTFRIKGFTCITCAVGLETMLRQQKGVLHAEASYPTATAMIEFEPTAVTSENLKAYIADMGFGVEEDHGR